MHMIEQIFLAIGLVLFFEGALYALFPDGMKKMMQTMLQLPSASIRIYGLIAAVAGVVTVWLLK